MKNFALILVGVIIAGAVFWINLRFNSGNLANSVKNTGGSQESAPGSSASGSSVAFTTLNDSFYLGDKSKAKIAIVEFSDFECPYCKRFHDNTFDQIVQNYVDTDKVIIVFRNFPLDFHKPAAEIEANAAACVGSIGGNQKFFDMVKLIYKTTDLNGLGMDADKPYDLAKQLGINEDKFKSCFDNKQFNQKIQKDIQDGNAAGVNGTPGFVIGKFDANGNVTGELVSGAQPFTQFQSVINKYLNK